MHDIIIIIIINCYAHPFLPCIFCRPFGRSPTVNRPKNRFSSSLANTIDRRRFTRSIPPHDINRNSQALYTDRVIGDAVKDLTHAQCMFGPLKQRQLLFDHLTTLLR